MGAMLDTMSMYIYDHSLFDLLSIPSGLHKQTVVDNICLDTAELSVIYPNFNFFREAIGMWSAQQLPVWERLYKTVKLAYNPINNYDRIEEHSETETRDFQRGSETTGKTTDSGTDTQNKYQAGYNAASPVLSEKNEVTLGTSNEVTGSVDSSDTGKIEHTTKIHASGNIGVTSSQDMIKQEREISEFNIISRIVDDFKNRFCILVY